MTVISLKEYVVRHIYEPIYLFGCGDLGRIAKIVCEYYGISVAGYIANDIPCEGVFEGIRVFSPEEAVIKNRNRYVVVCIFDIAKRHTIRDNLFEMGMRFFINEDDIISAYLKDNIKPIGFKKAPEGGIIVNNVTLCVTEVCSLRCKYCGNFIPYIKDPIHYPPKQILRSMDRLCRICDVIKRISFIGGEALTHPNVAEILEGLLKISKIQRIVITTNATIIPSGDFWQIISKYSDRIEILISNYGKDYKKEGLIKNAEEYGINAHTFDIEYTSQKNKWDKPFVPQKQGRSDEDNRNLYMTCNATKQCPMIRNGRVYKCETAAMGERLGLTPFNPVDSVDLLDERVSFGELREQLIHYMCTETAPLACDYCFKGERASIPMGEQLKDMKYSIYDLIAEG